MKKKDILNLIKFYADRDDVAFKNQAFHIANQFDEQGEPQLADYIMSLISNSENFVPQHKGMKKVELTDEEQEFFQPISEDGDMLLLPDVIMHDIMGIVNAVNHKCKINKFMFQGEPGTGKTEAVKQLARIIDRRVYMVNSATLIDSKLGQTQKNIARLFRLISEMQQPEKVLILFDELDAIALDRTDACDLREMGRAATALMKGLDQIDSRVVIVATTNLFGRFDKAICRRFDYVVDFNRYSQEDLLRVAERMLDWYLDTVKLANRDIRLFRKVIMLNGVIPYPGDLRNIIRTSVAFSDPKDGLDYLRRIYAAIVGSVDLDVKALSEKGFTVREIGILCKKSKSGVGRELLEVK